MSQAAAPDAGRAPDPARALAEAFGPSVQPEPDSFGIPVVKVRPTALREVARYLLQEGYNLLLDVGGVDYLGRRAAGERFEVVYHLLDVSRRRRLRLRVPLPETAPELPTVSDVWPAANWAEREVFDLFGIHFTGHPDLRRILMPEDWEGHPLRKDYPLRGPDRTPSSPSQRSRFFPLALDRPDGEGGPGDQAGDPPVSGSSRRGTRQQAAQGGTEARGWPDSGPATPEPSAPGGRRRR